MRISDWSSDVCSSDLLRIPGVEPVVAIGQAILAAIDGERRSGNVVAVRLGHARLPVGDGDPRCIVPLRGELRVSHQVQPDRVPPGAVVVFACQHDEATAAIRSEEHTSELQSLMRISYAVFCLKNKTKVLIYM